jgi:signal transduction histidine kinase
LLDEQGIPEDWTGAIVDNAGKIIARSRQHDRFVGAMASPDFLENATGQQGTWVGHTLEGTAVRAAYVRSALAGWRISVGVPETILEAALWDYLVWLVTIGIATLLLGLTLAMLTGRQLSRAMSSLARAAGEIGMTSKLVTPKSAVRDVQAIGAAMSRASDRLHSVNETLEEQVRERTKELESANAKLVQEMSDRTRAEQQLRQLQKMEAVGQLTGGLAHDFNNMLAVIGGSLELAQKRMDRGEPAAAARYLAPAQEGVKRAAELTQRMLAFSRQQPLSPAASDVNRLVSDMARLLQRTLGEQISIETVLAGGLWPAHVDANQLENALLNIAVNGRDAMPNGGKLTIETANVYLDDEYAARNAGLSHGQYVLVAVTDTGIGMSAETAAKAFDPFFTTKPVGMGTGMGLSQVYGFVRQSGGHVKIYSEEGVGTTLKVYLPRSSEIPETRTAPVRQTAADQIKLPPMTVLVVEDNDEVRQYTVDALAEIGCKVLQANGGPEAREILATNAIVDVLFTDIVMPGENGRVLADAALLIRPGLKVLFTTGYSRNAVIHNGVVDAGVHLIAKPFTIAELTRRLSALCDR